MEAGWVSGCRGAEGVGARVGLGKWGLQPTLVMRGRGLGGGETRIMFSILAGASGVGLMLFDR